MIALDERGSKAIAKGLRMRGIDVTMSSEEELIGVRQQFPTVSAMNNAGDVRAM
ncbi:hypothetical protein [Microcystis aeruginosa]|uniref:hypothetical protein n=1 Tax=Microcystis aeruginosa TaxID=1126 RepID=UPI001558A28D|nr:hypothetical protein [Microcystis aeruginosa]MDB9434943.1 hypothetical protein [Microcystis aeruginosa CS-552/01]MEB3121612.1 hypothetical protein [Snowella sp.]